MKNNLEIRNFIRAYLNESLQRSGEYSTEEMDAFINELVHVFQFNKEDDNVLYQLRNSVNVPRDRDSSAMSITAQDLINNWGISKERFGQENPTWYIWDVETKNYKDAEAIMKHAYQRYDKDSVLDFVRNNPEKIKRIKISFDSEPQEKFGKAMMSGEYGPLDEIRDLVKEVMQESFWTDSDWENYLYDDKKINQLKNKIDEYINSDDFKNKKSEAVEHIVNNLASKIYEDKNEYELVDISKVALEKLKYDLIDKKVIEDILSDFDYMYQKVNEVVSAVADTPQDDQIDVQEGKKKSKKKKKKSRKPKDVGYPYVMSVPTGIIHSFDYGVSDAGSDGGGGGE